MSRDEPSQLFTLAEVGGFLRRRGLPVLLCAAFGAAIGFKGSGMLPKRFRAKAIVTIQAGYFHHPLVSDSVAEIQDTSEMSAHRMGLIRASLTDSFLQSFGRKYLFPSAGARETDRPLDPEVVLKKVEYFATNATTFQVSVTTNSADSAFAATQELMNQIASTLARERRTLLSQTRQSLIHQAEEILASFSGSSSAPNMDNVLSDFASTEAKLAELEERLSGTHPDVVSMRARLSALRARLTESQPVHEAASTTVPRLFLAPQSRGATQEIFDDLLRKITGLSVVSEMDNAQVYGSYINVIEHPRVPMWPFAPNQIQYGLIGGVIGLVLGLSQAVVFELRRREAFSHEEIQRFLEIPFLGTITDARHRDV